MNNKENGRDVTNVSDKSIYKSIDLTGTLRDEKERNFVKAFTLVHGGKKETVPVILQFPT